MLVPLGLPSWGGAAFPKIWWTPPWLVMSFSTMGPREGRMPSPKWLFRERMKLTMSILRSLKPMGRTRNLQRMKRAKEFAMRLARVVLVAPKVGDKEGAPCKGGGKSTKGESKGRCSPGAFKLLRPQLVFLMECQRLVTIMLVCCQGMPTSCQF